MLNTAASFRSQGSFAKEPMRGNSRGGQKRLAFENIDAAEQLPKGARRTNNK